MRCRPPWKASKSPPWRHAGRGDIYVTLHGQLRHHHAGAHAADEGPGPLSATSATSIMRSRWIALRRATPSVSISSLKVEQVHRSDRQLHLRACEGRLVNLGLRHRAPQLRHEQQLRNQTLAQLDLVRRNKDVYKVGVYTLPKKLDEEVARLHLEKIGVKLTDPQRQAGRVPRRGVEGPYKPDHYRY